jgi:hypothetical protein
MSKPWLSVPFVLVVGCNCQSHQPSAAHLDLGPEQAEWLERSSAPAVVTIAVQGPSTIYVLQDRKMKFLFKWPFEKDGEVTVPLGMVSAYPLGGADSEPSGDHALFITVTKDLTIGDPVPGVDPACVTCARALENRHGDRPEWPRLVQQLATENWCCPVRQ